MSSPMQDEEGSSATSGSAAAAAASSSSAAGAASAVRRAGPSEFGKAFASKLEQLKTTDKQSITSLTILADEHRARADEVVEILKRRMQQLPSGDYRLPLMYLIDSICQNLGKKGAEYPRKMQPHIKPMLQSMLKHCSSKVKGSLYRMCAAWKKGHTFNKEPLAEIETMFHAFMTPEERDEALTRRSATEAATAPEDPRKRAHTASSAGTPSPSASPIYGAESTATSAPNAKKAMLHDPRRPPAAPAAPPAMIPEAAHLSAILESPDIAGRVELRGVVASMQKQLRRALPLEEMKALVAQLVIQLQHALDVAPPPQPAALPPPLPAQPAFNPFAPVPAMPLPMPLPLPLPPQPPAPAWNPTPLPHPSMIPPYRSPSAQPPPRVEAARPITLSEEDLKTKHPWLANSLYTAIPLVCKSCGRRIHTAAEMAAHLDWHFSMSKRAAHIAKTQSGSKWQNWYWEQEEWIMATDVIFGVQNRTPGSTAASKAKGAAGSAAAASKGYTPASLVADDSQPSCAICSEEFKKEWSDEDENWMYREVLRLGPEDVSKASQEIARIEAEKPAAAATAQAPEMDEEARALAAVASGGSLALAAPSAPASSAASNSTQTAALASKESDRLQSLWRAHKLLKHCSMFCGRLVHQSCHYGVTANIAKMIRPKEEEKEKDATAAEGEQKEQSRARDGASPAPGAVAAAAAASAPKLESTAVKPESLKTEPKLEPLPALE